MKSVGDCLYCPAVADSLEHVVPAAFGEFVDAPMLQNRVCEDCNNRRLGLLDEQLARCGPEGLFRKFYGIEGRKHHDNVSPFYRGSAGGRRLELTAWDPNWGVEVNLEFQDGRARQLREIIVRESSGKTHHLPIREAMTPERLRLAF